MANLTELVDRIADARAKQLAHEKALDAFLAYLPALVRVGRVAWCPADKTHWWQFHPVDMRGQEDQDVWIDADCLKVDQRNLPQQTAEQIILGRLLVEAYNKSEKTSNEADKAREDAQNILDDLIAYGEK